MTQPISKGLGAFLDGNNSACLSSYFRRISVDNIIGPFAEFLSKFSGQSDLDGTIFEPFLQDLKLLNGLSYI